MTAIAKTRDEIAEAYRSEPWWYDARGFFILTFAYNSTLAEQLRFFGANMGPRHLEVACGTGTLLELVLRWRRWKGLPATEVTGVDYAPSMLAGAVHRFRDRDGVRFLHGDAAALPFADGAFDTVNIANAVHCFPDVAGALAGVRRVLKPGGTLAANVLLYPRSKGPLGRVATAINAWGVDKGILVRPYAADEVVELLDAAGLEIVDRRVRGNCLDLLARRPADCG